MSNLRNQVKANGATKIAAAMTLFALSAPSINSAFAADTVIVQRDTQISELRATPYVLVRTPDGGYLVAGSGGDGERGWAVQLDAYGRQRWEFFDGQEPAPGKRRHSLGSLTGAVALPQGRSLFCGKKGHNDEDPMRARSGRVVIVDSDGRAEARDLYANGDTQGAFTEIDLCLKWGDGVGLLGTNGSGFGWLVRLDSKGQFLWEKAPRFGRPLDAIETSDHGLLVLSTGSLDQGTSAQLDRLDAHGEVVLTRQVDGGERAKFIRPWSGEGPISIVTVARSLEARLIRVDLRFKDVGPPVDLDNFYTYKSYFLGDHKTIALFGSVKDRGDTAAVARFSASNTLSILQLEPPHASFFIYDSVPTAINEFAVVRCNSQLKPILGWISLAK